MTTFSFTSSWIISFSWQSLYTVTSLYLQLHKLLFTYIHLSSIQTHISIHSYIYFYTVAFSTYSPHSCISSHFFFTWPHLSPHNYILHTDTYFSLTYTSHLHIYIYIYIFYISYISSCFLHLSYFSLNIQLHLPFSIHLHTETHRPTSHVSLL